MDIEQFQSASNEIIEKKIFLKSLEYADLRYDIVEEELHKLEDIFLSNYGDYLETILKEVHQKYCPDNQVLLPIAYFANNYTKKDNTYQLAPKEGVLVKTDVFTEKVGRMAFVTTPFRIVMQSLSKSEELELWNIDHVTKTA